MYRLSIFIGGDIFEHWELLHVGHVLDIDRTVGRDEEISTVRRALGPGTRGSPPETTIIYGKPGAGKSLVTRCVSPQAQTEADSHGIDFRFAYVDCSDSQSDAKASREMTRQLSDTLDAQTNIPRMGIDAAGYRDITWDFLNIHDIDIFVAVLDEADKLDDELLRSLIPAKESGKSDAYSAVVHLDSRRVIG